MSSHEFEAAGESDSDLDDFGFQIDWAEGVEIEHLTPSDERLIEAVSVPVRRPMSQIGEVAKDFRRRLEGMRVDNPAAANIFRLRKLEHIYMHPYGLEDVHYQTYKDIKGKSPSPYVSVSFSDILSHLPQDASQLEIMRTRQTFDAYGRLVDLGIAHNQLTRMATRGTEEESFLVRSLDRLLAESYLQNLVAQLKREDDKRDASAPLGFAEVAARATKIITRKYQSHLDIDPLFLSADGRLWFEMERRSLDRAMSFARPLMGLIPPEAD